MTIAGFEGNPPKALLLPVLRVIKAVPLQRLPSKMPLLTVLSYLIILHRRDSNLFKLRTKAAKLSKINVGVCVWETVRKT